MVIDNPMRYAKTKVGIRYKGNGETKFLLID